MPTGSKGLHVWWGLAEEAWSWILTERLENCMMARLFTLPRNNKAALDHGGLLGKSGVCIQRHEAIMHEPGDSTPCGFRQPS